jgi:hypothetical protein
MLGGLGLGMGGRDPFSGGGLLAQALGLASLGGTSGLSLGGGSSSNSAAMLGRGDEMSPYGSPYRAGAGAAGATAGAGAGAGAGMVENMTVATSSGMGALAGLTNGFTGAAYSNSMGAFGGSNALNGLAGARGLGGFGYGYGQGQGQGHGYSGAGSMITAVSKTQQQQAAAMAASGSAGTIGHCEALGAGAGMMQAPWCAPEVAYTPILTGSYTARRRYDENKQEVPY